MAVALMIPSMRHQHGSAAELSRHLGSRSDRFVAAAEYLPLDREDMDPPRLLLLAVAVEYRLKAYICAARGGAPQTRDLHRLAGLATHCGLSLSKDQVELISRLDEGQLSESSNARGPATSDQYRNPAESGNRAPMTSRLTPGPVRALCDAIAAQEEREPRSPN